MKSKARTFGYSLIEVLAAVSVIAMVAALVYPVLNSTKKKGSEAVCVSNLRQLHISIALYREQNALVPYGGASEMGLPPSPEAFMPRNQVAPLLKCTGVGPEPFLPARYIFLFHGMDASDSPWANYVRSQKESAVYIADASHQNDGKPRTSQYFVQYAFGMRLDGSLRSLRRMDSPGNFSYWNP